MGKCILFEYLKGVKNMIFVFLFAMTFGGIIAEGIEGYLKNKYNL